MKNRALFHAMLMVILVLVLGGCTRHSPRLDTPKQNTTAQKYIVLSNEVNLAPWREFQDGEVKNPKYSSNTIEWMHVSEAMAFSESQTLEITLESDYPLTWDNFEYDNLPQGVGVQLWEQISFDEQTGSWFAGSSSAKTVKSVSSYEGGKRLVILLTPKPMGTGDFAPPGKALYKLEACNGDFNQSHFLKYTVSEFR